MDPTDPRPPAVEPASTSTPNPTTAAAKRWYWEDFPAGSVREFGGRRVSRAEILEFAGRYDPQPFHLDEDAAKASLFGGLCASGWHTCAMTMRMMCDAYLNDSASLGSPGIENLRWTKPVYPGDTLHARLTVLEARPMASKPHIGLFRAQWTVSNQHGEPVMQMEGWNMMRRRDAAGAAVPPPSPPAPG